MSRRESREAAVKIIFQNTFTDLRLHISKDEPSLHLTQSGDSEDMINTYVESLNSDEIGTLDTVYIKSILDGVVDPHNVGAILRTGEAIGVNGVIIPKNRSVKVNSTVNKTSAGALEYMRVAMGTNLNETIRYLQENDVWIYGTDMDATSYYYEQNYANSGVAIVIGSEGFGMQKLVKENCGFLIKIPMPGHINSLNASVSAAIVMYEVMNQRSTPGD